MAGKLFQKILLTNKYDFFQIFCVFCVWFSEIRKLTFGTPLVIQATDDEYGVENLEKIL